MSRVLAAVCLSCLAASIAVTALGRSDGAHAQVPLPPVPPVQTVPPVAEQLVLQVGDTLRVDGARLGCQVTDRGGRPTIECRRDGRLAGTYGTFIDSRKVTVARFRNPTTAQTIVTARHGGRWRACRAPGRASAAQGTCR